MTTQEKITVMQAYTDGKPIQRYSKTNYQWVNIYNEPNWNWEWEQYRIKPEEKEPEYRPYKDAGEMVQDFKNRHPGHVMQLIWVKSKEDGDIGLITGYSEDIDGVLILDNWTTYEQLLNEFTFLDNTPCGKKV